MAQSHHIEIKEEKFVFSDKAKKFSFTLIGIGLILSIIGIFTIPREHHHADTAHAHHENLQTADAGNHDIHDRWGDHQINNPAPPPPTEDAGAHKSWYARIYANLLLNGYFFLLLAVGGLFFVGLQYIANAGWATALKRVPEAMATFLPIAAIVMIIAIILGKNELYHWVHYEHENLSPGETGYDKILASKSWFLNTPIMIVGIILIPLIWYLFGQKLKSLSLLEDKTGGEEPFRKSIKWSAAFTFIYAFSFSVLSWWVIMSIDSHWYSTIFSVYNFATGWVSTLAVITLLVLFLKSKGYLEIVTDEHIHDLGKFVFAFSIFWAYLWISQMLLIWYAQIPEEVMYYQMRLETKWKAMFYIVPFLNFIVPFLILMTRDAKRNTKVLSIIGLIILIGHWGDIYLMIMPGSIGSLAHIGFLEVGMTLFFSGIFIYWVLNALTKQSLIAVNHPYIEESAHHDVGV
jgi:hypothetical protein